MPPADTAEMNLSAENADAAPQHACVTHQVKRPWHYFTMAFTDALLLDAGAKWLISQQAPGNVLTIIPNFFSLYHAENTGVAFGLFGAGEQAWLPLALSGSLIAVLAYVVVRYPLRHKVQAVGYGLLLGGGVNNWLDRLLTGTVTDYLYFSGLQFPIFNLSDVFIFIGSVMVMFYTLGLLKQKPKL